MQKLKLWHTTGTAGAERDDGEVHHDAPARPLAELRDQGEGRARRIRASLTLNNISFLISTCAVSFSDPLLCVRQIMLIQNYSDESWCRRNTLGWSKVSKETTKCNSANLTTYWVSICLLGFQHGCLYQIALFARWPQHLVHFVARKQNIVSLITWLPKSRFHIIGLSFVKPDTIA